MLSSVVNSLTYRVLSPCFLHICDIFLAIYTYFCDKKLWNLSTFLVKHDSIMVGVFAYTFGALFGKSLLSMQCLVPKSAKMCIFWDFLAWFCTVLLWDFFTYFFELFITCFVHFFLQKSCVFMFFEKHNYHDFPFRHCIVHDRVMVICASLWKFYLNVFSFFLPKMWSFCTHFCSLILSNFWGFSWFLRYFVNEGLWNIQSLQSLWGVENHVFCNFWHIYTRKIMKF